MAEAALIVSSIALTISVLAMLIMLIVVSR